MEDKSIRNKRNVVDKLSDFHNDANIVNSELCYEDQLAISHSATSPEFQLADQILDKHCRSDDCREHNIYYSRSKDHKQKDLKAEVHRLAEYVCGDWSKHVSSSGKHYYYNCKTEVSQWEKPKEWSDMYVYPSGIHSHFVQSQEKHFTNNSVDVDVLQHLSAEDNESCSQPSVFVTKNTKQNDCCSSQCVINTCNVGVAADTKKIAVTNLLCESYECDSTKSCLMNNTDPDKRSIENCNWSNSQSCLPVGISRIYGLVSSNIDNSFARQHSDSKSIGDCQDVHLAAEEDMDISPGSTPTEESLIEKRITAAISSCVGNSVMTSTTRQCISNSGVCDPVSIQHSSLSSATFLSTLTSLQNALHHVTPTFSSSMTKSIPSSALSLLASLPALVNQLQQAEHGPSEINVSANCQQIEQQHIMQQVIQMLQRLQQALVAQQQQQQQRQLQELLLQLLNMQKHGNCDLTIETTLSVSPHHVLDKMHSSDGSCDDIAAKVESPYSPPDSDGTPLGSPENHCCDRKDITRQACDVIIGSTSPKSNEHRSSAILSRQSVNSPDRTTNISPAIANGSGSVLLVLPGTIQSTTLVGTSQLVASVHRKQQDSIGLTPSLANYVNRRLIDHIAGWQTDAVERQVNCYNEESYSFASLQCTQISVDLKQARSLVRLNEIQTTLQEQRVMFIRHQTRDLENMRAGYTFQASVHTADT